MFSVLVFPNQREEFTSPNGQIDVQGAVPSIQSELMIEHQLKQHCNHFKLDDRGQLQLHLEEIESKNEQITWPEYIRHFITKDLSHRNGHRNKEFSSTPSNNQLKTNHSNLKIDETKRLKELAHGEDSLDFREIFVISKMKLKGDLVPNHFRIYPSIQKKKHVHKIKKNEHLFYSIKSIFNFTPPIVL